jgi:hypothetical protein
MSETLRAELREHLRRIEEQIAQETQEETSGPHRFYKLSLLSAEHGRVRRHLEQLENEGGDAG